MFYRDVSPHHTRIIHEASCHLVTQLCDIRYRSSTVDPAGLMVPLYRNYVIHDETNVLLVGNQTNIIYTRSLYM